MNFPLRKNFYRAYCSGSLTCVSVGGASAQVELARRIQ